MILKYKKNYTLFLLFVLSVSLIINIFLLNNYNNTVGADVLNFDEQESTIRAIKMVRPAVVSIIVYGYVDSLIIDSSSNSSKTQKERREFGSGTGFLISSDGLILTNKHVVDVVSNKEAEYRIILNNGQEYYAQLIDKDPINDLAVLKIFDKNLPYIKIGNSDKLEVGASVIAIGNTLGTYHNSATKGIVSGLGRDLFATDNTGREEKLSNVIQTDAEINSGNSGGPLIDLVGRVVGINVAVDSRGSAIGFAIPINDVRPVIKSIKENGYIVRPHLGVHYIMLNSKIANKNNLKRSNGAWIVKGENNSPAVLPGSPADKAGLSEGDIVFEINAIKLEGINTLARIIQRYNPGDRIGLKIQRGNKILIIIVRLEKFEQLK